MLLFFILFFPISLALRLRSLNLPNKITLLESQKTSGKTNIIFSQDPSYYFYLLTTPPLIQSNEADFECQITNEYFNVSTKVLIRKKEHHFYNTNFHEKEIVFRKILSL